MDDRAACEGPTWTHTDHGTGKVSFCSSAPEAPCDHHPNGPFSAKAFRGGIYRVCTEAGACADIDVDRNL